MVIMFNVIVFISLFELLKSIKLAKEIENKNVDNVPIGHKRAYTVAPKNAGFYIARMFATANYHDKTIV